MDGELVAQLNLPNTHLVNQAEEFAQEAYEPYLFNHVVRSWLFGAILAEPAERNIDSELLAVAALFHDLGLTDNHASEVNRFEVDGANAARNFLSSRNIASTELQLV